MRAMHTRAGAETATNVVQPWTQQQCMMDIGRTLPTPQAQCPLSASLDVARAASLSHSAVSRCCGRGSHALSTRPPSAVRAQRTLYVAFVISRQRSFIIHHHQRAHTLSLLISAPFLTPPCLLPSSPVRHAEAQGGVRCPAAQGCRRCPRRVHPLHLLIHACQEGENDSFRQGRPPRPLPVPQQAAHAGTVLSRHLLPRPPPAVRPGGPHAARQEGQQVRRQARAGRAQRAGAAQIVQQHPLLRDAQAHGPLPLGVARLHRAERALPRQQRAHHGGG